LLAAVLLTVPFRLATQTFLALGQPKLQSNIVLGRLVLLFALTPLFFRLFGFPGAVAAIVLSHFSSLPLIIFYNIRNHVFDLRKELLHLVSVPVGLGAGKLLTLAIAMLI
jgi:O-antigen/teichoic acid export membrane protein